MEGLKDSMAEYAQEGGPRARQLSYRYPKPLPAILGLISAAAGFALAAHHQLAPVLAIGLVFSSWVAFLQGLNCGCGCYPLRCLLLAWLSAPIKYLTSPACS